jgi:hypothetical protein
MTFYRVLPVPTLAQVSQDTDERRPAKKLTVQEPAKQQ